MSHREFIALVGAMRVAQRDHFRTRNPRVISEAKRLEREVDRAIEAARTRQLNLFEAAILEPAGARS